MIAALFEALSAGLSLWQSIESRKYLDKLLSLKKKWYEEYNKDPSIRSDAVLDDIEFELRILSTAFSTSVREQNSQAKS